MAKLKAKIALGNATPRAAPEPSNTAFDSIGAASARKWIAS
jgi:hypothetical protein